MKSVEILTCCTVDQALTLIIIPSNFIHWFDSIRVKTPGIGPEACSHTTRNRSNVHSIPPLFMGAGQAVLQNIHTGKPSLQD